MNELTPVKADYYSAIEQTFKKMSSDIPFEREVSFAIQHLHKNDYLQKASRESILKSVLNVAQIGLTLNPVAKYAYLVPRYNSSKKQVECVLDPSYVGLSKLLTDSGSVKAIHCQIIYDGDDIDIDLASDKKILRHIPYILTGRNQGDIKAVYSMALLHDNSHHVELMSYQDVLEIRDKSEAYKAFKAGKTKTCIWVSDESEMVRKTCIKRHYKHLPKSDRLDNLQQAIDLSYQANGYLESVRHNTIGFCESLISSANLSEEEKHSLTSELHTIEYEYQAKKMIGYLNKNQPIVGVERFPGNMAEIKQAVKEKVESPNS